MNNPGSAASKFVEAVDRAISSLESNPYLGVVPRDARLEKIGYRMLIVGKYLVFYKVTGGLVKIKRVIHGARLYTFLL
jgi:plasmid stabilization system protein ParE